MLLMNLKRCLAPVLLLLAANGVWAQTAFSPAGRPPYEPWVATVIAIILMVCVGVGSFMNSKRGHQD